MTQLEILGTPLADIEIGATGLRELAQNVKTIMSTWRATVFLDRRFGTDSQIIDQPVNTLIASLIMDLTEQIERYEPRVSVVSVTLQNSDASGGHLIPLAQIRVNEGVLL
jgi:phage baseplate assembly protein W